MKTIVLGAGIAGLAYLNNLRNDDEVCLYEKDYRAGGLCKSFKVNGFTFDCAVHLSFANSDVVRKVFDKEDYYKHFPIAYNFYKDRWLKHPVINNLSQLTTEEKCELIESFVGRDSSGKIENYEDWLLRSYGRKMVDIFYNVYTRKYWTLESREMSASWIGERLASPDLHKVLYGAFETETGIDYYAKEMRYPKNGGYESFIKSYMDNSKIMKGKKVIHIDADKKMVSFEDGTYDFYDKLVSSIPLCEMPFLISDSPEDIKLAAKKLMYSKISIVSVGFNKPDIPKALWMYIYDEDIMAARINSPSIKSVNNAPKGCSSMQFEIYHRNDEVFDSEEIIKNVRYSLKKMKICNEEDIMFMDYKLLPYGNVIFYKGMENDRKLVKDYIQGKGVEVIGRFGEWDYLWSDQSFLSGYNMALKHSCEGVW